MTEIGMALSNPLHGERVPGSVGRPLPGVEVQLVAEDGKASARRITRRDRSPRAERLQRILGKPEATREAFRNGWFRTGDTAVVENGVYRILGRTSIDILKTGGHKVSALEIEETLRAASMRIRMRRRRRPRRRMGRTNRSGPRAASRQRT